VALTSKRSCDVLRAVGRSDLIAPLRLVPPVPTNAIWLLPREVLPDKGLDLLVAGIRPNNRSPARPNAAKFSAFCDQI
jgi:hypothetical protein